MRFSTLLLALLLSLATASAQVGTLDPTFGTGGIVVTDLEAYDDFFGVAALPDGTIAVVGRSSTSVNVPETQSARYVRYDDAGALLDAHRYDNGVFGCGVPEGFYDLVVEPGGTLLVGGYAQFVCGGPQHDFWVHRLQPDGTSEIFARPSFYGVFENAWSLARHPDASVTVGGVAGSQIESSAQDIAFARYTPDGEVDLTFGTMGETTVDVYGDYDFLYDLVAMPDGGVLAAGFADDGSQRDLLLIRLDSNGTPDPSFGTDGVLALDFDGGDDYVFKLARQPDGQILAAGRRENPNGSIQPILLRLAPDGTLDPTFGTGGIVEVPVARAFALQADGKIVLAGSVGEPGSRDVAIARLLPGGTLDPGFGTNGMQTASWSEVDDLVRSLTIMPDGDLVVLGNTREDVDGERIQDLALARFVGDTAPVANEESPGDALALTVAPNPTRGRLAVQFSMREPGPVRLAVYDALGREVAVLADGLRQSGEHTITADLEELPAGAYLVRLGAGRDVAVRPFARVR